MRAQHSGNSLVVSTLLPVLAMFVTGCGQDSELSNTARSAELSGVVRQLAPLHKPLGKPQRGDWLESHDEPGQTFAEYLKAKPVTPRGKRRVIYVQPLGNFTETQRKIVDLSAEFLGRYFGLPVTVRESLALDVIPDEARRKHPEWGMDQILSPYVLDKVLKPKLPHDAAVFIAFTASDLWPGKGWNFVFGQASLRDRVGVWSIYRNGNPNDGEDAFRLCLLRTLKTATHETGHMFSIRHCTKYQCNMCGSNNRDESDRHPLYLCAECVVKVCWATGADPVDRFESLAEFCREHQLKGTQEYYLSAIEKLSE